MKPGVPTKLVRARHGVAIVRGRRRQFIPNGDLLRLALQIVNELHRQQEDARQAGNLSYVLKRLYAPADLDKAEK